MAEPPSSTTPIREPGALQTLARLAELAVQEGGAAFRLPWLAARGWIAMPRPGDSWTAAGEPEAAALLAGALAGLGVTRLRVANLDVGPQAAVEGLEPAWETAATPDAIVELGYDVRGFYHLAADPDVRCALLFTVEDFHVVAGPLAFVTAAVGGDLSKAERAFEAHAATWARGADERQLRAVCAYYEARRGR